MSFVVHTEELNLVSTVAEAEHDDEETASSNNISTNVLFSHHDESSSSTHHHHVHDLRHVFHLALPTMIIQLGSVLPSFLTASYIGRNFDVIHLDGFMLASLTCNLFTLSLLQGLYSASDTLSPQAYGAGNRQEVGVLAIRGFVGSMLITLPIVMLLAVIMDHMLVGLGEDEDASRQAWHWYQIYVLMLPFYALYQVTWKFLSAQNVMWPLTICVLLSCCIVLPLSLWCLGGAFGYLGTALAIVIYEVFQSLSLLTYLWWFQPHDKSTWPGLKCGLKAALKRKPFVAYMVSLFYHIPFSPWKAVSRGT